MRTATHFWRIGRRSVDLAVAAAPTEDREAVRLSNQDGAPTRGQAAQAISHAVVRVMREYTGRGPTQAHTTINDNVVIVVLRDTLLKAERSLVDDGHAEAVIMMRR